jgi:hypothetical protein
MVLDKLVRTSAVVLMVASAVPAKAQPDVRKQTVVTQAFVIEAIDHPTRSVTLQGKDGNTETIVCGPEVERFDALEVGDKVTFTYHESVVYRLGKPGSIGGPEIGTSTARTPGDKPGGTFTQEVSAAVTVDAVDLKTPSVTFTTAAGHKRTVRVERASHLDGVKPGDRILVTYTQAVAVSVK